MLTKSWKRICCTIKNRKIAFLVLCTYALAYGTNSTLLPAMVTTLEKRFDLTASEVSWLLAANDIGYLLTVLFVAYYGGRGNHVKCLVASAIGLGLSGYLMTVPYMLFGNRYSPDDLLGKTSGDKKTLTGGSALTLTAACSSRDSKNNGTAILSSVDIGQQKAVALGLQMVAGILTGVSTSPFWNLGISFLDDIMGKKSGIYIGSLYAIRCVAPIIGFAFASFLNTVNESLKFRASSYPGGQKDPFWIGTWWLGFLVLGTLVILTAPCLSLFNRKAMIRKADEEKRKVYKAEAIGMMEDDKETPEKVKEQEDLQPISLKDLLKVVKAYWGKPIFLLLATGKILEMAAHIAFYTFFPKFVEFHFRMTASGANMLSAITLAGSAIVATAGSGIISHFFPMTPKNNNFFNAITNTISALMWPFLLLFVCPTIPIMGSDNSNPTFDCAPKNCSCPLTYKPVCVDNLNYFSACQAGCESFNASASTYSNCLCRNLTAVPGVCGGACSLTYYYAAYLFVLRVVGIIAAVQNTQFLMALGNKRTKPFGMATMSFIYGITGTVLPLVSGKVIESFCLVRNPSATGRKSFCVLYDVDKMRVTLHLMSLIPQLLACLFYFLSWYKTPKNLRAENQDDPADQKVKDAAMISGSISTLNSCTH